MPSEKQANRQIDPLDDILECIKHNPQSYSNMSNHNNNNNSQSICGEQEAKNNSQGNGQEHIQKISNATRTVNDYLQKGENNVRTRYGEPSGSQIDSRINKTTSMLAWPTCWGL